VDRRLVIEGGRRAVQLIYKDRHGRRISLFSRLRWKEDKTPEVRVVENGGVRVAYSLDGLLTYGLVGHLKRDQLMVLAKAARRSPQFIRDTLSTHVNSRALPGVEPDIIRQD
jgi:anti-sigma factor RsiW